MANFTVEEVLAALLVVDPSFEEIMWDVDEDSPCQCPIGFCYSCIQVYAIQAGVLAKGDYIAGCLVK